MTARARHGVLLFGGAFDPPHKSHRRILKAAYDLMSLAQVIVIPAGRHPFKPGELAPDAARLELCELAFGDLRYVEVSDHELQPTHSGFTVDTLRHFREALPRERLFWLIGYDNLPHFPRWREADQILRLATLVLVARKGYPRTDPAFHEFLRRTLGERAEIFDLEGRADDVSSSRVRELLRTGGDVSRFLAPAVERRIRELGLYGARPR